MIGRFIEEKCNVDDRLNPLFEVQAKLLYDAYKAWCEENGERWDSQTMVGKRLTERGYTKIPGHLRYVPGHRAKAPPGTQKPRGRTAWRIGQ